MSILSQNYLRGVRLAALRKRTWYRVLDRVEQGIIDLTIGVVEKSAHIFTHAWFQVVVVRAYIVT